MTFWRLHIFLLTLCSLLLQPFYRISTPQGIIEVSSGWRTSHFECEDGVRGTIERLVPVYGFTGKDLDRPEVQSPDRQLCILGRSEKGSKMVELIYGDGGRPFHFPR